MTRDFLPHLHEPEPGLLADIGCTARDVGLQTAMGVAIARYLQSGSPRDLPLPILPIREILLHGLQRRYVIAWYRMNDAGIR